MYEIRVSNDTDGFQIERVHTAAFGDERGPIIARLISGLVSGKTTMSSLSLVAVENSQLIGHALYMETHIPKAKEPICAHILAPLAVLPDAQKKGVGSKLIDEGLEQLRTSGVDLVFVLGHPEYYRRCGFAPAQELGLEAPYPVPEGQVATWMVRELNGATIEESGEGGLVVVGE